MSQQALLVGGLPLALFFGPLLLLEVVDRETPPACSLGQVQLPGVCVTVSTPSFCPLSFQGCRCPSLSSSPISTLRLQMLNILFKVLFILNDLYSLIVFLFLVGSQSSINERELIVLLDNELGELVLWGSRRFLISDLLVTDCLQYFTFGL